MNNTIMATLPLYVDFSLKKKKFWENATRFGLR